LLLTFHYREALQRPARSRPGWFNLGSAGFDDPQEISVDDLRIIPKVVNPLNRSEQFTREARTLLFSFSVFRSFGNRTLERFNQLRDFRESSVVIRSRLALFLTA
jgi:hypothetical protein